MVTLASSGATVVGGTLADGKYSPTISAPLVTTANGALDGNGDGVGGDNYTVVGSTTIAPKLFRLFGDADGDGDVDITDIADFVVFRGRFGTTVP